VSPNGAVILGMFLESPPLRLRREILHRGRNPAAWRATGPIQRRAALTGSAALAVSAAFATRVIAAAPPPTAVTPALIEAARREARSRSTRRSTSNSEKLGKTFEAPYPACRAGRAFGRGGIFQRIGQELSSRINAVRCRTHDGCGALRAEAHGWLAPYVPEDAGQHYPKDATTRTASM